MKIVNTGEPVQTSLIKYTKSENGCFCKCFTFLKWCLESRVDWGCRENVGFQANACKFPHLIFFLCMLKRSIQIGGINLYAGLCSEYFQLPSTRRMIQSCLWCCTTEAGI